MRTRSRTALACVLASSLAVLVGCGDGGSGGGGSGGGSGGGEAAISEQALAELQAKIDKYKKEPEFTPPGAPIDPRKLAGKRILTVPSSSAIPFCQQVDEGMTEVAKEYGVTAVAYENQGQPSQWAAGMTSARDTRADLVNLACGIDPAVLVPQIREAKQAGIKVVAAHNYDPTQKPVEGLDAVVHAQYKLAGELEADWTILQTKGNANVLVVDDVGSDVSTPALVAGIRQEFAKYCPSCRVTFRSVNIPDWATKIQPIVAAELTRNPKLNYIIPVYDGMVQFVLPAITAAAAGDRVKIATFNATPSVLSQMKEQGIVTFDVGEDFNWLVRAILDQNFRVLLGEKPSTTQFAGLRIFDQTNVDEAGSPPRFQQGYGQSAQQGFEKLWSGSGS
jgi:ribose transport system substrate-binding protein